MVIWSDGVVHWWTGTRRLNVKKDQSRTQRNVEVSKHKETKTGLRRRQKVCLCPEDGTASGQCRALDYLLGGMLISTGVLVNCIKWWGAWNLRRLKSAFASTGLRLSSDDPLF